MSIDKAKQAREAMRANRIEKEEAQVKKDYGCEGDLVVTDMLLKECDVISFKDKDGNDAKYAIVGICDETENIMYFQIGDKNILDRIINKDIKENRVYTIGFTYRILKGTINSTKNSTIRVTYMEEQTDNDMD